MRKLIFLLFVFIVVTLTVFYWPNYTPRPELDGEGPLSVQISAQYAAPEYHSPLDYWKTHHTDMVNRGDLDQQDCLYCHEPELSCNNCHGYVGANKIPK